MSSEESLRQHIEALKRENAILKGRQMALYTVLADLRTNLTEHHGNATQHAVALLKAAVKELEGWENG